ncbi:MAG: hypothetical protein O2854_03400, partial [Chloroflexi bacterium]|nr:hypothetical protein [Chloroflexota bacterium]
ATEGRSWPAGMKIHSNTDSLGLSQAEDALDAILSERHADWVVADGYSFHGRRLHDIAASHHTGLFVVDDVPERTLSADIVFNQNLSDRQAYQESQLRAGQYLLGTGYSLIASEYREAQWRPSEHTDFHRILVSFGGLERGYQEKLWKRWML